MKHRFWKLTILTSMLIGATVFAENEPLETFVENDEVKVSLMNIGEDDIWGYEWKLYLENNTDKTLMYSMQDVSVNGLMSDPLWATEIFTCYPKGEENKTVYVREKQDTDIVLVDNDSCAVTVIGYEPDDLFGYTVSVYLENRTDKKLMYSTDNASVNGFMCDPFWAEEVAGTKTAYSDITWFESSLEEQGITDISEITLPLKIYDSEDWSAEPVVEEPFTLNP